LSGHSDVFTTCPKHLNVWMGQWKCSSNDPRSAQQIGGWSEFPPPPPKEETSCPLSFWPMFFVYLCLKCQQQCYTTAKRSLKTCGCTITHGNRTANQNINGTHM
jgi:hypothetical protein